MEEIRLTIIIGTLLFLFFVLAFVFLFSLFNKKNQLHRKEKEIIKAAYEQTILQSQLEIQEQTFNTISQEIHDNVGQLLSLAKVQLNIIEETDSANKTLLGDAKENISQALTDLRDIAKSLSSERMEQMGLKAMVEQEIQRINRTGLLKASFAIQGDLKKVNTRKKVILHRIIQECLQNILKHAQASSLAIIFDYGKEVLTITITDNGSGFDFAEVTAHKNGLGLQNIATRTSLLGGRASITSTPEKGTTIQLFIPYE